MLLKEISHYKTGTTCDQLYSPCSKQELSDMFKDVNNDKIPYYLLGAGSNSLIMDEHWDGTVIIFDQLKNISVAGNLVRTGAGVKNTDFANICLDNALSGASWMNTLPGQIGATTRMNARCYGGEICEIVKTVTSVSTKGEIKEYSRESVFLGYKNTIFMTNREIIVEVEFQLPSGNKDHIATHMDFCENDRIQKHQFLFPSCGCIFKNNYQVDVPSGLLLEKAEVRKYSNENVEVSPYHANFVFNRNASAAQILEVTFKMRDAVYEKFGVWMEYEMEVLGNIPEDLNEKFRQKRPHDFNKVELKTIREAFHSKPD